VQTAVVLGAGNLFRGLPASNRGMGRVTADTMGMLATVMNALALEDALRAQGLAAKVLSAIPVPGTVDPFSVSCANELLAAGAVVLFAGGTGHPFFTTDTTAALRACEIGADAIIKATKVDGVYTADPVKHPAAQRYRRLAYTDALAQRLEVMDAAAFSLCMENRIPILVFNFFQAGNLQRAMVGDTTVCTLVCDQPSELDR
jgi:uridylate kinase